MVGSTNQARQFYVLKGTPSNASGATPTVDNNVVVNTTSTDAPYVQVYGMGGITRSDLLTNISSIKVTDAEAMSRTLKSVKVALSGTPVVGQHYILRVTFRQFAGMSDEETYSKYGQILADSTKASDFYKKMAISLALNFSRDVSKLVEIKLITTGGNVTVTKRTKEDALTGTYTGILIDEVEQPWARGIKASEPVYYDVIPGTITTNGVEAPWGTATTVTGTTTVHNGKTIADMEYFYMGERGDQYRNMGWPNVIVTEYMVDASKSYSVLDVHYSYVGDNESSQKSEKDLTIVGTTTGLQEIAKWLGAAAGMKTYDFVGYDSTAKANQQIKIDVTTGATISGSSSSSSSSGSGSSSSSSGSGSGDSDVSYD